MKNSTSPALGGVQKSSVIFDMDGLMLDTEGPMIPLWIKAGKSLGWEIKPETVIRTMGVNWEGTREIALLELGPDFPWDRFSREINRLHKAEYEKGVTHKKGLIPLLDHLSSRGIPMAVATSSPREAALWMLRKAGIFDYFTVFVCGDEVVNGKPCPDIFLLAAERLGRAPAECIGFEDSPAGLQGLHSAGIRSVFIKDLVEPSPDILSAVWRIYGDLSEAVELFA